MTCRSAALRCTYLSCFSQRLRRINVGCGIGALDDLLALGFRMRAACWVPNNRSVSESDRCWSVAARCNLTYGRGSVAQAASVKVTHSLCGYLGRRGRYINQLSSLARSSGCTFAIAF